MAAQNALFQTGQSKVSGDAVRKVYDIYKQNGSKKAIHIFPTGTEGVMLKLKNSNNPEILIGEGKENAFLNAGFHGSVLKMTPFGSKDFSDKYVFKVSIGNHGAISIVNEDNVLKFIKSKIGNNRKAGIQKAPTAFASFPRGSELSHCQVMQRAASDLSHVKFQKMTEQEFLKRVCTPLLLALKITSECHVMHGDIKPDNCLFDDDGAFLADFGSATILLDNRGFINPEMKPFTQGFYVQEDGAAVHESLLQRDAVLTLSILKKRDVYAMGKTLEILLNKYYGYYGNQIPRSLKECVSTMQQQDHRQRPASVQAWEMWEKAVEGLKLGK